MAASENCVLCYHNNYYSFYYRVHATGMEKLLRLCCYYILTVLSERSNKFVILSHSLPEYLQYLNFFKLEIYSRHFLEF